jgi:flagellar hook-associated protein 2
MLDDALGGDNPDGSDFVYTIVKEDGSTQTLSIANTAKYSDLLAQLGGTQSTDSDGNTVVTLDGVTNFYLSTGSGGGMDGISVKTEANTQLAGTFVGTEAIDDEQPALNYTITLNGGEQVTVDGIASGSSIKDIYEKFSEALEGTGSTAKLVMRTATNGTARTPPAHTTCRSATSRASAAPASAGRWRLPRLEYPARRQCPLYRGQLAHRDGVLQQQRKRRS